ncbi:MAG: RagB/SusD family nutrient uptake outer membrane protein, partial [Muribaculaceae bacterium]|nr:RagB/SusD family nutrient uptake outer membrane protein [Muribaculaceae bacterium]
MKLKYILSGTAIACIMSSCSNYLDIKPYDKVIPETAEDFAAMIHYRLNQIDEGSDGSLIPAFSTTSSYDAGYGDDFEVCLTGSGGSRLPNYVGSKILSNGFNNHYSGLYEIIRDCNIVIHEMKESGTEEADNLLATAYAMRGVAYYQL